MVFWAAVLVGALFAWIAVRVGFYATWILFFNLLLSITVALFVTPALIANIPDATKTPYGCGLTLLAVMIGGLLLAYGTCFACLSGRFYIEFHRVFDASVAGLLGFLTGFFVASFVAFVVCLTPVVRMPQVQPFGLDAPAQRTTLLYLCWWCDRLHAFVMPLSCKVATADAVSTLLAKAEPPKPKTAASEPATAGVTPPPPAQTTPPTPAATNANPAGQDAKPSNAADAAKTPTVPESQPTAPTAPANQPSQPTPPAAADESPDALLAAHKTLISTADAIEAAVGKPETRIIEIAETLGTDRFSPHAVKLLQNWVSQGGVLWAHNDALQLFGIEHAIPQVIPADTHCVPGKQHPVLTECKKVVLQPCAQKSVIAPSNSAIPLLLSEADIPVANQKAGSPLWSIAPYGKGWISDPKPIDLARYEGARFWRNFCLFCLGKEIPGALAPNASGLPPDAAVSESAGFLTGQWQSLGGAVFRIEDNGQTITIELVSNNTLLVCSGKLTRRDEKTDAMEYNGRLAVVFHADAPKQYSINMTATLMDSNHLRLVCPNWPKPNGSPGTQSLRDIWSRRTAAVGKPQRSISQPPQPREAAPEDPFATPPVGSEPSGNWP